MTRTISDRWSTRQRLLFTGIGGAVLLVVLLLVVGALTAPSSTRQPASRAVTESVRRAAEGALTEENAGFVIDQGLRAQRPAAVRAQLLSSDRLGSRFTGFSRSRSRELATGLRSSFVSYVDSEFTDRMSSAFRDRDVWASSRFHVDRWYPVHVSGRTAHVRLRGEDRGTAWDGSARTDNWAIYALTLTRDRSAPHGWRLTRQTATSTAA